MFLSQVTVPASDIENLRYWYMRYFAMRSSEKHRSKDGIESYTLAGSIDAMSLKIQGLSEGDIAGATRLGFCVESSQGVEFLTELLRTDGNEIVTEPTTDEYGRYMSQVVDPEGNLVTIFK